MTNGKDFFFFAVLEIDGHLHLQISYLWFQPIMDENIKKAGEVDHWENRLLC